MEIQQLYDIAEQNGIDIDHFPMEVLKGLSIPGSIALNPKLIKTRNEEKEILAHELGHQIKYAFYKFSDTPTTKARAEVRADRWAVEQLIPLDELKKAFKSGYTMAWQLAEYFDVSCGFIEKAIRIYRAKGEI